MAEVLATVAGMERADISLEKSFIDDLSVDSLMMAEVVVTAEDRCRVLIPDDDWARFRTVGDALRYLEQLAASPPWSDPELDRCPPAGFLELDPPTTFGTSLVRGEGGYSRTVQ